MYRGPRVLVVDDEAVVRSAVAGLLSDYASEIQQCGSVKSAVGCLAARDFDVIVCDMFMPDVHGLELIKKIREEGKDIAFVVMTGKPEISDLVTALRLHAAGFLEKPFNRAQLLEALDTAYLALRKQRRIAQRIGVLTSEVAAKSRELRKALADLRITERSSLEALVSALDAREHETCAHSFRVRAYTSFLAEHVNYPSELLAELDSAALLHDIGKISIPDSILLKPGALTAEEFEQIQTHAACGARILGSISSLQGVANIVKHHHEHWDGRGYPDHLIGENIPLGARLFTIADTLDALLSDRCYRPATSFANARKEILRCSGTQFDPDAVEAFLHIPEKQWADLRAEADEEFSPGVSQHACEGN